MGRFPAALTTLLLAAPAFFPTPHAMAGPLADRIESVSFTLPDKAIGHRIQLAATSDGQTMLTWTDTQKIGNVAVLEPGPNPTLRSLAQLTRRVASDVVARPDGFTILAGSTDKAEPGGFLTSFDREGRQIFETKLVGPRGREIREVGDRLPQGGALSWSGQGYAAYFSQLQLFNDGVVHQGDGLQFFDNHGRRLDGGWNWGVSHSFGVSAAYDGKRFVTATVGDASPRGLVIDLHAGANLPARRIFFPATGRYGETNVPVVMGGLVANRHGTAVAFTDNDDRPIWRLHDVGVVIIKPDGSHAGKQWITQTDEVDERQAQMAAYGDQLFITYAVGTKPDPTDFVGVVIDWQGRVVSGPEPVDMNADSRHLITYPNGDVGWLAGDVTARAGPRTLRLNRLRVQH